MVGLAALGGSAAYVGKVRDDTLGRLFRQDLRAAGVDFEVEAAKSGPATGRCMVFVTPDAQRTMQTYLGASATLSPRDIDPDTIGSARIVYMEGYLYDPPPAKEAFRQAAMLAHRAGRLVSLSLSDPFCVDRHREDFLDLVERHVDILFANEEEILSLYQATSLEEALGQLRGHCQNAAITLGEEGSIVLARGRVVRVEADRLGDVVDTTGAGDLYASGFLYGWTRGRDPAECGRLGSIAAGEIITHFGARPACSLKELVGKCQIR
jgi:sugar/nucleoside kinase (ribokinase family)